jgi:pimeloyl-ACP methyl ester carboxylesterase
MASDLPSSPIVVFIPGFSRGSDSFGHWRSLLPADVRLLDLPGHLKAPAIEGATLDTITEALSPSIPRDALVVGESIGGLVALKLATRGYRAVAVDPPLSTAKLWTLKVVAPAVARGNPQVTWLPAFVENLFGIQMDGTVEERNYWPLLDEATKPVHVIAGSLPLWPVRPVALEPETTPSVLDEIDAFHLRRHPNVRYQQVEGPHTLLTERVDSLREALLTILAER